MYILTSCHKPLVLYTILVYCTKNAKIMSLLTKSLLCGWSKFSNFKYGMINSAAEHSAICTIIALGLNAPPDCFGFEAKFQCMKVHNFSLLRWVQSRDN